MYPRHEVERAPLTPRRSPTMQVSHAHQQGMELVEELHISGQAFGEEPLGPIVVSVSRQVAVTGKDSPSVQINHKNRLTQGIQEYRIRGLLPDPVQTQKFLSQQPGILRTHPRNASLMTLEEIDEEGLESPGFQIVEAGGS